MPLKAELLLFIRPCFMIKWDWGFWWISIHMALSGRTVLWVTMHTGMIFSKVSYRQEWLSEQRHIIFHGTGLRLPIPMMNYLIRMRIHGFFPNSAWAHITIRRNTLPEFLFLFS